jgi:hypothetical protein
MNHFLVFKKELALIVLAASFEKLHATARDIMSREMANPSQARNRPCNSLSTCLTNEQPQYFKISITPFPLLFVLFFFFIQVYIAPANSSPSLGPFPRLFVVLLSSSSS